jgi:hypothetical protein
MWFTLNDCQFSFLRQTAYVETIWLIISTRHFPNSLTNQNLFFTFSLFFIGRICCCSKFPMVVGEAPTVLRRWLVLHQSLSKGYKRNPPMLTLIPTAPNAYWFPTGCAPYVPTFLWLINKTTASQTSVLSYRLFLNWSDVLRCHFVHRHARKILKTYSESSSRQF